VKLTADLHIHSCLSPCGDENMNPADLVRMSFLNGVQLIALTDHNTARNCPAAAAAAAELGMGFIPGAEVNTSEDIHAICLFPDLSAALEFDRLLYEKLPDIPNRPDIFGEQILCGPDGEPCGAEPRLLIAGCGISILELPGIVAEFGGVCYPAHVDRDANSLLYTLGSWPPELESRAAEVRDSIPGGLPRDIKIIKSSDAHRLEDLPDPGFELDLETASFAVLTRWLNA